MRLNINDINKHVIDESYEILKETINNNNITESQILKEIKGQNFLRKLRIEIKNALENKQKENISTDQPNI